MDRATFDRERIAVQEELRNAGQEIEIPDPDSSEYLSTFLALQRTHPRLAARLAEAEQADPAELLDPYTPRPSKVTVKHRLNAFLEKNFMRRGIDRKLVLDRQKVFRTGLYTLGGIVVAGLVWSVVAPKPAAAVEQPSSATAATSTTPGQGAATRAATPGDTSGAFTAGTQGAADGNVPEATQASAVTPAPRREENTFASTTPDTAPRPISAESPSNTPPPPAVFNQVPQNDPYTPVAASPAPDPAPVAMPEPAPAADVRPSSVVMTPAATPVVRSAPFGGAATPEPARANVPAPIALDDRPVELPSPFTTPAVPQGKAPAATRTAQTLPAATPEPEPQTVSAPFGGETATATPSVAAEAAPTAQDAPARGAAMIYQAQRQPETLPKSSLVYQRQATENAPPKSALIYQAAQSDQQGTYLASASAQGGSMIYKGTTGTGAGSMVGAAAQAQPSAVVAQQAPDPDAPKFAPTSVIKGKLFSNIRTAAGLAVPVIVLSQDGNWVGLASYNTQLGRVDMRFTSFVVNKNGKSYSVDASAYQAGSNGTISEGVGANVHPIAPTLAVDLARAGLNSLNTYTQALQGSGTTTVNGSMMTTTRQAPALIQVVRGEIGKVFALPEGNVSIRIVADVAAGTEIQVVYGVSASPVDPQTGMVP